MSPTVNIVKARGEVKKFLWANGSRNHGIMQVEMPEGETVALVGPCVGIFPGDVLEFEGTKSSHPIHGHQIKTTELPKVVQKGPGEVAPKRSTDEATLDASVANITFRNPETGYTVCRINDRKLGHSVTLTGTFGTINEAMEVRGMAVWVNNPKFGPQLQATPQTQIIEPVSGAGILRYLQSGALPRVGKTTAQRIFDAFGKDSLRVLREDPERVSANVKGVSLTVAKTIQEAAGAGVEVEGIVTWLMDRGLPTGVSYKIYKMYKSEALDVLTRNPWTLCDIDGIGFLKADEVAQKMGKGGLNPHRVEAAVLHAIKERSGEGHTGVYVDDLKSLVLDLLRVQDGSDFDAAYRGCLEGLLRRDDIRKAPRAGRPGFIQRTFFDVMERRSAENIVKIAKRGPRWNVNAAIAAIPKVEEEMKISLSSDQREAVEGVLRSGISLLIGGPGRGKTTVTGVILGAIAKASPSLEIRLASPTGKAAMRLSEATGRHASTVHRLLEWGPDGRPSKDSETPMNGDLFVFDEVSMKDAVMLFYVLNALPETASVLMIGDKDQLPSVGAGSVLSDLMDSGAVKVAELVQVHRQAAGSLIIQAADAVNAGDKTLIRRGDDLDIVVPTCPQGMNPDQWSPSVPLQKLAVKWATEILPGRGFAPEDIQVITAGKKAPTGTEELNALLRKVLNPDQGKELKYGSASYRAGDRILVTKNNYDLEVFNGMTGNVMMVMDDEMLCMIEGRHVKVPRKALKDISLGYALTCHKMQGSQAKCVILVVDTAHWMLLERNWLYTAITRAAKHLVILSAPRAVGIAVKKTSAKKRQTMLLEHLNPLVSARMG